MRFEWSYTREQEGFRKEVRAWLKENAVGIKAPPDPQDLTYEQFQKNMAFQRRLGKKGWYAPTWPKEYGGGGLTPDLVLVLQEELTAAIPNLENLRPPGNIALSGVAGSILDLETEERKRQWLPHLLQGE
ncbi:MAG: acyl-CoA dehydrogenase family protein [Chloroflexi bacterium]|nr:acyl-CoA dehydrogenase family protein [Chloroflexota bacterium]